MTEQKMGTNYARELIEKFRSTAEKTDYPEVKEKLNKVCDDLEPLVKKLYFKTQKGTEDMKSLADKAQDLDAKLDACKAAEQAEEVCQPFFDELEKVIKHVKTMKVRMT